MLKFYYIEVSARTSTKIGTIFPTSANFRDVDNFFSVRCVLFTSSIYGSRRIEIISEAGNKSVLNHLSRYPRVRFRIRLLLSFHTFDLTVPIHVLSRAFDPICGRKCFVSRTCTYLCDWKGTPSFQLPDPQFVLSNARFIDSTARRCSSI